MWLKQFKAQAAIGFVGVITLTVAALAGVLTVDRAENDRREALLENLYRNELATSEVDLNAERIVAASRGYLLLNNKDLLKNVNDAESAMDAAVRRLDARSKTPGLDPYLDAIRRSVSDYRKTFDEIAAEAPSMANHEDIVRAVEGRLVPRRLALGRQVKELDEYLDRLLAKGHAEASASASREVSLLVGLGSVGVVLALLLAWLTAERLDGLYAREREAKRQAEQAGQAREDLLGVVAHDLRNPLNAVLMRALMIRDAADGESIRKSAEALEHLAKRMAHLIESLLEAASIESGHFSITPGTCTVSSILASTLEMFGNRANERSIRLVQKVTTPDLVVAGDLERIIQVLSNFLSNALKFSPEGGTIELSVEAMGALVRFEVRDSGPGIARERVPFVFDRYWKATEGNRTGTGLGLYIAKGIVEAHGGRIGLETEVGRGSTFFFEIPRADAGSTPSPTWSRLRERGRAAVHRRKDDVNFR